ncbi:hypothetical protein [Stenotrophobium rhamnosiphilum]|uniref:hypothetical protein n=1 Tax=Stenotrophobium rhamnosiphilum TaxID=2029166 RepID=UPI0011B280F1|nr:hypothetical protein [Stenotrophobium rhamnosiphilum]
MKRHLTGPSRRPGREAIAFLVYDVILIALTCISPYRWMMLVCALLSAIAAIRAATLFAEFILHNDEIIEEDIGVRIDGPQR